MHYNTIYNTHVHVVQYKVCFVVYFTNYMLLHTCMVVVVGVEQEQSTAASVERLESDQVDLRARLQCCEQDLKTGNEC